MNRSGRISHCGIRLLFVWCQQNKVLGQWEYSAGFKLGSWQNDEGQNDEESSLKSIEFNGRRQSISPILAHYASVRSARRHVPGPHRCDRVPHRHRNSVKLRDSVPLLCLRVRIFLLFFTSLFCHAGIHVIFAIEVTGGRMCETYSRCLRLANNGDDDTDDQRHASERTANGGCRR